MALAAPAVPVNRPADCLAALLLPQHLQLTADQFAVVCQANPDAVLELDASGHVIRMTPTGSETGARNTRLLARLQTWADRSGGWLVFDSSSGFHLPDGSVLSPEERRGFAPLCPDLVVELASPGDEGPRGLTALRRQMERYQANGALLGWRSSCR